MRMVALLLFIQPAYAQIAIVNAGTGNTTNAFAPGSLVLIDSNKTSLPILNVVAEGIYLAQLPASLPTRPTTIGGTTVNIATTSFGLFTGPISAGTGVFISGPVSLKSIYVQPGTRYAVKNNGPLAGLTQPAHPGDYLTIYGTGLGNAALSQVSIAIAGLPIPVTYAGPAPGQPGVDQINAFIPNSFAVPDSCYDAFSITVSGVALTPQALPFTQTAQTCPSPAGYNASELGAMDNGSAVPTVQLSLSSGIAPSTPSGFIRSESAFALQVSSTLTLRQLNFVDGVYYTCQTPTGFGQAFSYLASGYNLALTMGGLSIPITSPIPPAIASTIDALPPSIFQPGTWQLAAPNFSAPLPIPPPIQFQSAVTPSGLTVTWNPTGYSASDVVNLSATNVSCNAPATAGAFTIPASYLTPGTFNLTATVEPHPDQTPHFRLPQPDGSTLPLQVTYSFSETLPVTVH